MKNFILTTALCLTAGVAFAENYTTKSIDRLYTISPAEARTLLPEPYGIGIFQCPVVPHESGAYMVTPPIAKAMRQQVQAAHSGSRKSSEETIEVPVEAVALNGNGDYHPPETVTITVQTLEIVPSEDIRGASAFGIGDVLFTFNALAGQCDLWAFRDAQ